MPYSQNFPYLLAVWDDSNIVREFNGGWRVWKNEEDKVIIKDILYGKCENVDELSSPRLFSEWN